MGGAVSVKPLTRSIITVLQRQFTPQLVAEHPAMPASGKPANTDHRRRGADPALGFGSRARLGALFPHLIPHRA